jgi:hypothetical protein
MEGGQMAVVDKIPAQEKKEDTDGESLGRDEEDYKRKRTRRDVESEEEEEEEDYTREEVGSDMRSEYSEADQRELELSLIYRLLGKTRALIKKFIEHDAD